MELFTEISKLNEGYEDLISSLWEDEFEFDFFKEIFKETYDMFEKYFSKEEISKQLLSIFEYLVKFANFPSAEINNEYEASRMIVQSFITEFNSSDGTVQFGSGNDSRSFYVSINNSGTEFNIDEFDISELIEELNQSFADYDMEFEED